MNIRKSFILVAANLLLLISNQALAGCNQSIGGTWICTGSVGGASDRLELPWLWLFGDSVTPYSGTIVISDGEWGVWDGHDPYDPRRALFILESGSITNNANTYALLQVSSNGSITNNHTLWGQSNLVGDETLVPIMLGGPGVTLLNSGVIRQGRNTTGLEGSWTVEALSQSTSLINTGSIESFGLGEGPESFGLGGTSGLSLGMTIGILGLSEDTVVNSGRIASDYPDSYGVLVNGSTQVDNSGTIQMLGDGSIGVFGMAMEAGEHLAINNLLEGVVSVSGLETEGISVIASGLGQSGYINNVGTITAEGFGAEAIVLWGTGEILHSGVILASGAESEGIVGASASLNDYVQITTTGDSVVSVQGDGSSGIGLSGMGSIDQAGTVDVVGAAATGMYVDAAGASQAGTTPMTNRGQVTVNGDYSVGMLGLTSDGATIDNQGRVSTQGLETIGIGVIGNGTTVRNSGQVVAEGAEGIGIGIQGDNVTVTNTNTGRVEVTEVASYGIGVQGEKATVNNRGAIVVRSSDSAGIGLQGNGCSGTEKSCGITNSNSIETDGTYSHGILVAGNNLQVSNDGSIVTRGLGASGIEFGSELFGVQTGGGVSNTGSIQTNGREAYGIKAIGEDVHIVNSRLGTISTAQDGAHGIVLGSDVLPSSGDVLNLGTININGTAAAGIYVTADGAIVNHTGKITTIGKKDAPGISATGDNQNITLSEDVFNMGADYTGPTITTNGENSNAIQIKGNGATVDVRWKSVLRTYGDDSSAIVVIGDDARVTNAATIETGSDTSGARSHGIFVQGNSADSKLWTITNLKNITVNGIAANGIYAIGDGLHVLNSASVLAVNAASNGIAMSGDNVRVTNSGVVEVQGIMGTGIELATAANQVSVVKNQNEIKAIKLGTIAIQGGAGNDTVRNSGAITGTINLGAGDDTFILEGGDFSYSGTADGGIGTNSILIRSDPSQTSSSPVTAAEISGFLSGFQTFRAEGGYANVLGTIIPKIPSLSGGSHIRISGVLEAESKVDISDGAFMTLESGSRLVTEQINIIGGSVTSRLNMNDSIVDASAILVAEGGSLTGTGLIDLSAIDGDGYAYINGGTILPGHSPGMLTIDGNLIFDDGYLGIDIWGVESDMYDLLKITGEVTFDGGMIDFIFADLFKPTEFDFFEFLWADSILGLDTLDFGFSGSPEGYYFDVLRTDRGLGVYSRVEQNTVPEPGTLALLCIGLFGMGMMRRRRQT